MRTHISFLTSVFASVCASVLLTSGAVAQEAMYTAAATLPSPGTGTFRPQAHISRYGTNPLAPEEESTTAYEAMFSVAYGLDRGLAGYIDVTTQYETTDLASGGDDSDKGVEDVNLYFKYRFYKHDSGGIDTQRAALMLGAHVASGDDKDFSSTSINPHIGAVLTIVRGRHGFNQDLFFTWNTGGERLSNDGGEGPDDAIHFNSAYVYRIWPDAFTSESTGGWYITAEINNLYETNGDFEMRFAPGLMYEGRHVSWELMAQFPLYNDLDERAELDFAIGTGIRVTF
jgi:hypothetical protein